MKRSKRLTIRGNIILKELITLNGVRTVVQHYNAYARVVKASEGKVYRPISEKTLVRYAGNGIGYEDGVPELMAKFIRSTIR